MAGSAPASASVQRFMDRRERLSRSQEKAMIEQAHAGDDAARDRLVAACLPFAYRMARRYVGADVEDLRQYAVMGLLDGSDAFDAGRYSCRLLTYASWHIRKAVRQGLCDYEYLIRFPRHIYHRMCQAAHELGRRGMPVESDGAAQVLSEVFGWGIEASMAVVSLPTQRRVVRPWSVGPGDVTPPDYGDAGPWELDPALRVDNPEGQIADVATLEVAMQCLSARERHIVGHHYGVLGMERRTAQQMRSAPEVVRDTRPRRSEVSRQRVWQIRQDALRKMVQATAESGQQWRTMS